MPDRYRCRSAADGERLLGLEAAIPATQQHRHGVGVEIGGRQVGLPVAVEIPPVTENGPPPTANVCWVWKLPSPLPNNTDTLLSLRLATARSSLPSPLKSATPTEIGRLPTANVR
jgi:hypothetical protein